MESRIEDGRSARLGFTFKDPDSATRPADSFPWAQSIVVVAIEYLVHGDGPKDDRTVARFADGDRYEKLKLLLNEIKVNLENGGWRAEPVG